MATESNLNKTKSSNMHAWKIEELSLITLFFALPFDRLASLGQIGGSSEITLAKILFIITLLIWLVKTLLRKDVTLFELLFKNGVTLAALCFLAISLLSIVNCKSPEEGLYILGRRIGLFFFYFLMINVIRSDRVLRWSITALLIASIFSSGAGLYELFTGEPILRVSGDPYFGIRTTLFVTEHESIRIQSFAGDPDFHNHILIILFGLALSGMVGNYLTTSRIKKHLFFVLVLLYTVNIAASGSRGGWVGLAICIISFFLLAKSQKRKLIAGVGMIVIPLVFLVLSNERFNTPIMGRLTGKEGSKSIQLRKQQMIISFEMIKRHPFIGIGTGNTETEYHRYLRAAPEFPKFSAPVNANGYLHIGSENGLVGLIAYLFIHLFALKMLYKNVALTHPRTFLTKGILASYFANLFCLAVFPVTESEVNWLILGLAVALNNIGIERLEKEG